MSLSLPTPSKLGMVGRDRELHQLLAAWRQLRVSPSGSAVLLQGVAGVGKSRLARALRAEVELDDGRPLVLRCSPDHRNSALFPLVRRLRSDIGLAPGQPPTEALSLLRDWVARQAWSVPEALPLLACLLGVALPAAERIASLSGGQRRQVHSLLAQWLLQTAARGPALLLAEDLHWADPSTLEVLGLVLDGLQPLPLLVLLTARPGFVPPWPLQAANRHSLQLDAFGAAEVEALVLRLTGGKRLPTELVQRIHGLTDGVPLHVEELTKLLLESDALDEGAHGYRLRGRLDELPLPASLSDSVQQRLQRLPAVQAGREVAQLAAAVGREFSEQLIAWLWTPAPGLLVQGLDQLVDAELLLRQGQGGQARYVFKHALVREAAYASLDTTTRRQYHARIAEALLRQQPDLAQRQPEVLAHHRTGAGEIEAAIPLWLAAADRAIETSAHAEGVAHVNRAIELLDALPDTPQRCRDAATLQIRLGVALAALQGYAADAVGQAYAQAVQLAQQSGDESLRLPAHYGLWRYHLMRADYARALELAAQLLEAASQPRPAGISSHGAPGHGQHEVLPRPPARGPRGQQPRAAQPGRGRAARAGAALRRGRCLGHRHQLSRLGRLVDGRRACGAGRHAGRRGRRAPPQAPVQPGPVAEFCHLAAPVPRRHPRAARLCTGSAGGVP